jgi:two-component system sensor histidine kinase HydH
MFNKYALKLATIIFLIAVLSIFIFVTRHTQHHYHSVYREFYFIPLILGAFWFGLRGALLASCSITLFYLAFIGIFWQGLSAEKINTFIEIIFLNGMALVLGILREREHRERRRTQKMESLALIGKTVSGIAHDMKIPLVAIAGFSRRILKKMGADDPHREKLTIIYQEAQRLESMVKDMLDYARPLNLRLSREDVNQVIQESMTIVKGMAKEKQVTIEGRLSSDIPSLNLDPMRIKRVLINLLTNAVQASPPGESVFISSVSEDGRTVIDITDHGPGISAEQKENLFTPFFTTKKEGIGLGLVMVKNIVFAHGGEVQFIDNPPPETGVTFRVVLPKEPGVMSSSIQK